MSNSDRPEDDARCPTLSVPSAPARVQLPASKVRSRMSGSQCLDRRNFSSVKGDLRERGE